MSSVRRTVLQCNSIAQGTSSRHHLFRPITRPVQRTSHGEKLRQAHHHHTSMRLRSYRSSDAATTVHLSSPSTARRTYINRPCLPHIESDQSNGRAAIPVVYYLVINRRPGPVRRHHGFERNETLCRHRPVTWCAVCQVLPAHLVPGRMIGSEPAGRVGSDNASVPYSHRHIWHRIWPSHIHGTAHSID